MTNNEIEMSKIYFTLSHAKKIGRNVEFTPAQAQMMIDKYIQLEARVNKLFAEICNIQMIAGGVMRDDLKED